MENKNCFVIIGYGKKTSYVNGKARVLDLDETYKFLIRPVFDALDIPCYRAIDKSVYGGIDKLTLNEIRNAYIVLADLSTLNANVMWELGVRHALKRNHTIMICEKEQMSSIPFDINTFIIHQYNYSEEGIPYKEVERFQKYLTTVVSNILNQVSPVSDSPVFAFLEEEHEKEEDTNMESFASIMSNAEAAKNSKDFETSLELLKSAKKIAESNMALKDNLPFIISRQVLCTYRSKRPNELEALVNAKIMLDELQPMESNDVEVIGLSAAINKRLSDLTKDTSYLDSSIQSYEKAFQLKQDYYYGTNVVFMLYKKASLLKRENGDWEDIKLKADYIRNSVLDIALKLEADPDFLSRNHAIWVLYSIAELYGYRRDEVKQREYEEKAEDLVKKRNDLFALDSYKEQKEKIGELALSDQSPKVNIEEAVLDYKNKKIRINEIFQDLNSQIQDIERIVSSLSGDASMEQLLSEVSYQYKQGNYLVAMHSINRIIEFDDEITLSNSNYFPHPELYELKARILNTLNDSEGAKAALDRYVEINDENKYRINLKKKIQLERLVVEDMSFFGSFTWNFTPGMNILLGKNGFGKSHLLRFLTAMLYNDKQRIREWISPTTSINAKAKLYVQSDHPVNETELAKLRTEMEELLKRTRSPEVESRIESLKEKMDAEQRRILASKEGITSSIGKVPILAIPDSRFIDRSQTVISNSKAVTEDLRRDGALDFLSSNPYGAIISKGLFVVAQKNGSDFTREPYSLIQRVISDLAYHRPAGATLSPTPLGNKPFFKFSRIESTTTTGDYKIYVRSEDNNEEVLLNNISQGTFSVLAICLMIYRFLSEMHPQSPDPLHEHAIVIIDEIDAHLHPSWEQKFIGILRREFPNIQFLITGHSPLIVAGCLEREVSVIRHNSHGFSLEQSMDNFIGYSTPELFQKIFEIEDKDDQYLIYSALAGKENEFKEKAGNLEDLKKKKEISPGQEQELNEIYKTLTYIDKVKGLQVKQAQSSTLETENILLQHKVRLLENTIAEKNNN